MDQLGGTQLTFESIMTPTFLYFVITLVVIGYIYHTRVILSREQNIKQKSMNLLDKNMFLEVGFMILIGLSIYILNNNENNTFIWIFILIPIVYLVVKSLLVFNKLTEFIKEAPTVADTDTDLADLISQAQAKSDTNTKIGEIPVTNLNSNNVDINAILKNELSKSTAYTNAVGIKPQQPQQPQQPQFPQFANPHAPEGFSLF